MKYLTIAKHGSFAVVIRTCQVPVQLKPFCKLFPFLQTLPWRPEKALQRHSQSVTESLRHQPQLRGSKQLETDQSGGHLFAVAQSLITPTGLLQLSNAAKTGKAEPLSLRQQPPSTVHTAPDLSSVDWPHKPSPHPQGQTLQAQG